MEREFTCHNLAELFRDLYLGEASGALHLSKVTLEKRIYFDRGMIQFAESGAEEDDLGRRLLENGVISPGALAEAKRSTTEAKDLPRALINRGLVSKDALARTGRSLTGQIVRSCFTWELGTSVFKEGQAIGDVFETDIVTSFEMILGGVAVMVGFEIIKEALRGLENRVRIRVPTPVPLERLALSPAHGFILSRVDGTSTLRDILSILPHAEEEVACRFLYGLLVMGVLVHEPPLAEGPFRITAILKDHADHVALEQLQEQEILEGCEAVRNKNPNQVLGVPPSATRQEIEAAYLERKERYSRDRVLPRVGEKLRSELSFIDSRLVEAYLTLCQPRVAEPGLSAQEAASRSQQEPQAVEDFLVRVEMDKTRTKMAQEENARIAEAYFGKARKYVREGDYYNAIQYGKLAISYAPEDARFYFLLGECQVRNPDARWQRMAEQSYVKAAELDPWNADYHVSLGRFYKRRGLGMRARKQFEQALQLVPGHEVALEEIESLS